MATLIQRAKKLEADIEDEVNRQPMMVRAVAGEALFLVSQLARMVADLAEEVERGRQK